MSMKSLIKKADLEWSKAIIRRDRKCLMTGLMVNLDTHHGIVPKSRSDGVRWLLYNGFTLNRNLHTAVHAGKYKNDMVRIIDLLVSKERQEEIVRLSHKTRRYTEEELKGIIKYLKEAYL